MMIFLQNKKEFEEPLERATNKDLFVQKDEFKEAIPKVVHHNSLITKNIYLFTKDPNYKIVYLANGSAFYIFIICFGSDINEK